MEGVGQRGAMARCHDDGNGQMEVLHDCDGGPHLIKRDQGTDDKKLGSGVHDRKRHERQPRIHFNK